MRIAANLLNIYLKKINIILCLKNHKYSIETKHLLLNIDIFVEIMLIGLRKKLGI